MFAIDNCSAYHCILIIEICRVSDNSELLTEYREGRENVRHCIRRNAGQRRDLFKLKRDAVNSVSDSVRGCRDQRARDSCVYSGHTVYEAVADHYGFCRIKLIALDYGKDSVGSGLCREFFLGCYIIGKAVGEACRFKILERGNIAVGVKVISSAVFDYSAENCLCIGERKDYRGQLLVAKPQLVFNESAVCLVG